MRSHRPPRTLTTNDECGLEPRRARPRSPSEGFEVRHLVGVGVLASVADAATTWLAIQLALATDGVEFVEVNPAMDALIAGTGEVPAMALRVLIGVALFAFLAWASRRSRWGTRPLAVAAVLTCGVVAWNVGMLAAAVPVA